MKLPSATFLKTSGLLAVCLLFTLPAQAQSRGELLYTTHCIACHGEQMHWRDKKLATDWTSLKAQVVRWQGVAQLRWTDGDVLSVTEYLNGRYYSYPKTTDQVSLLVLHVRP